MTLPTDVHPSHDVTDGQGEIYCSRCRHILLIQVNYLPPAAPGYFGIRPCSESEKLTINMPRRTK